MAVLDIHLGYASDVKSAVKRATNELSSRKSDYEGIMRNVNNISSNTGNLSDCNVYLRKKNQQLQNKIDKLNRFSTRVGNFETNAKAADKRVATYIKDESNTFYKTVGIKTGWAAGWDNFKKGAKNLWQGIKDFYNEHKFVIDFIVDVALVVVAVVSVIAAIPTGGATLFFAGFALATAAGDLVGSSVALGYHIGGDDEKAGVWADRGLKDGMKWIGKQLDGGEDGFFSGLMGLAYDGLSIAATVYSIGKLGKDLFKSIDLRNTNSVWGRFKNAGKTIFGIKITGTEGKDLAACWQIKTLFNLQSVDTARKIMISCDIFKDIKNIYGTINGIMEGTFFEDGNEVGSKINKVWKGIKDFYTDAKEFPKPTSSNYNTFSHLTPIVTSPGIPGCTVPVTPSPFAGFAGGW